jgi:penicillin-binding protein 1C
MGRGDPRGHTRGRTLSVTGLSFLISARGKYGALGLLGLAVVGFYLLPVVTFERPFSSVLYADNGSLLDASLSADEQWRFPKKDIKATKFIEALVQFEDKRFYSHPGLDPLAIARALYLNLSRWEVVSGASTLTMQVVRLARRNHDRSLLEKVVESFLALRLEFAHCKAEILALYAAHAPFGGNVVGLEAAAWRYFGRPAEDLSWAESATLAVLPNSPALIHPGRNRRALKAKRNKLLDRLLRSGVLESETNRLAKAEPLPVSPLPIPHHAPHLLDRLKKESGAKAGIEVRSTVNWRYQRAAHELLMEHHERLRGNGIYNGAILILDVKRAEVAAYVGNVVERQNPIHGNHVDIITSSRSTGSILKPLLFAAALEAGELLTEQLVLDIPTRFGGFRPENYNRSYSGAVPAREALARSLNVPAVRQLNEFGIDRFYGALKKMGMTTLHRSAENYGLSLILGGAEGSLWDITSIYADLSRSAQHPELPAMQHPLPRFVSEKRAAKTRQAQFGAGSAYLTLEAMLEVSRPGNHGLWRSFSAPKRIAWKTGTSFGFRDAWAVGVTPRFAVGVWVGNASGEGRPELTGFRAASPLLFDVFNFLPTGDWFERPHSVLAPIEVCSRSGFRASGQCRETRVIATPKGSLSVGVCPHCTLVHTDASGRYRVHGDCEPISKIKSQGWFSLPPVVEVFYRARHPRYRPPPEYRLDCRLNSTQNTDLALLYPRAGAQIYVPKELGGDRGKMVMLAGHRREDIEIYWHLNTSYLGATQQIHQISVAPPPGQHTLVLVDSEGARIERQFTVLGK